MTRRERLEAKVERRMEWAGKADVRSNAAMKTADSIAEHIPFGQPILVGHHSERHARRNQERIANNMDKCVEQSRLADHHREKAAGLSKQLEHAIFSDDPDAIEALEAKISNLEKTQEFMVAANKICRNKKLSDAEKIAKLRELAPNLSNEAVSEMIHPVHSWQCVGFASFSLTNNNANIRRCKARLESIKRRNALIDRAEKAESGIVIDQISEKMSRITFSEKPEREILNALRTAGFR